MKKLVFLFVAVLLTAISTKTFAQSTGLTPAPGATHVYTVNAADDHGSNYAWSVLESDFTTDAVAAGKAVITGTGNSVSITWVAAEVAKDEIYYVRVKETNSGCVNEKVLKITIGESNFYLVLTGATTSCYDGDPVVSLNGSGEPQYNHGTSTITYTVTPHGLNSSSDGYEFDFSNTLSKFGPAAVTVSANATLNSGRVVVSDENVVTIQIKVTSTVLDNTDTNGSGADFTSTNNISNGVTGNGVADNSTGTYQVVTSVSRPHTTTISAN